MAAGQGGLTRDTGLRMVVEKVNSADARDVPLGSEWIASSTGMVLWGPLTGISLWKCKLAAKGSFAGKMR